MKIALKAVKFGGANNGRKIQTFYINELPLAGKANKGIFNFLRYLDEPHDETSEITDPGDWLYYDHIYTNNQPETREILKDFYELVKTYNIENRQEERVVMLEAWLDIEVKRLWSWRRIFDR